MRLRGVTVLIVEDHADSREILRQMVRVTGARVLVAANGQEALEALEAVPLHLILCDLVMPVMNGFEFAQRVRSDPCHRSVPIIALTMLDADRDFLRTLEAGFDAHLVKPLDYDTLAAMLRRFVPARRRRRRTGRSRSAATAWILGAAGPPDRPTHPANSNTVGAPMEESDSNASDVAEPLDRLRTSIAEIVGLIEQAGGAEREQTLALIEDTLDALSAAAAALRPRGATGDLAASDTVSVWIHELAGPVTAMMGWAQVFRVVEDEAKRDRAREAIERNARLLGQVLKNPPV